MFSRNIKGCDNKCVPFLGLDYVNLFFILFNKTTRREQKYVSYLLICNFVS